MGCEISNIISDSIVFISLESESMYSVVTPVALLSY